MNNIIFTAIIGNYDTLKDPLIFTPGWKYVCFTDNKSLRSDVWAIVQVDNIPELKDLDDVRKARYLKIMFHKFFFSAGITIWHDASMQVNCDLDWFINNYYSGSFTTLSHPDRNCIYKEAVACCKLKKDDVKTISSQMDYYWRDGYPEQHGLAATGLLIREVSEFSIALSERWWREVSGYSSRDQLSFDYVMDESLREWSVANNKKYDIAKRLLYTTIPFYVLLNHFILNKHNGR